MRHGRQDSLDKFLKIFRPWRDSLRTRWRPVSDHEAKKYIGDSITLEAGLKTLPPKSFWPRWNKERKCFERWRATWPEKTLVLPEPGCHLFYWKGDLWMRTWYPVPTSAVNVRVGPEPVTFAACTAEGQPVDIQVSDLPPATNI